MVPYSEAKSIGLVINEPLQNELIPLVDGLIKQFRGDGKATERIIIYAKNQPKAEAASGNHFKEKSVDNKDIGPTGLPKSETFKSLLAEPYDYLIFCNPIRNFKTLCLAGLSKGLCKIGPSSFAKKHLNLIINCEEANADYFNSIYSTLNQIR